MTLKLSNVNFDTPKKLNTMKNIKNTYKNIDYYLISMNGCHESFYMYELNNVIFFANINLI